MTTVLRTSPRRFVTTPAIERVTSRALRYLQSGFSIHLRGPAGTGKTTLALHLADLLERPMMLMFGDDDAKTSDLIGTQSGYTRKKVVDNYIHSVVKVEDQLRQTWVDSRLTLACREGFTLIYDEFNRSRPEVNNVLLSVLEEKILVLPPESNRVEYVRVSPHFRAIFTSNPEEYCGVHSTQDALMDRLITISMPEPDELTQQEILVQKAEIDRGSALLIVRLVKAFRTASNTTNSSGLRSGLMIATICQDHGIEISPNNPEFRDICQDILLPRSSLPIEESTAVLWQILRGVDLIPESQSILKELVPISKVMVAPVASTVTTRVQETVQETRVQETIQTSMLLESPEVAQFEETLSFTQIEEVEKVEEIEQTDLAEFGSLDLFEQTAPEAESEAEVEDFSNLAEELQPIAEAGMGLDLFAETAEEMVAEDLAETIAALSDDLPVEAPTEEVQKPVASFADLQEILPAPVEQPTPVPVEDQIYRYLLANPTGARLSQIESDLSLQRSQAIDAIRKLAQGKRLAQRDRYFVALK